MSILPIYTYGNSILRQKAKPVTKVTDDLIRLIIEMFATMRSAQGIGLAANQVGSMHRVIVVDVSELEGLEHIKPLTLINPEIISEEGSCTIEEGCLSVPDFREEVERAEKIKVKFKDINFQEQQIEAHGILCRVILHEIDHLNGILFFDRLPKTKKIFHQQKIDAIQQGEIRVSYPIVTSASVTP